MMIEVTGASPYVRGNNKAIEADGPSPGKTPTNVPIKQPTNAASKLMG